MSFNTMPAFVTNALNSLCATKKATLAAALLSTTTATSLVADAQGYNYKAYDQATRTSPGGWVTEYSAAHANACAQKRDYPNHVVSILKVHNDQSWSQAVVVTGNVSC